MVEAVIHDWDGTLLNSTSRLMSVYSLITGRSTGDIERHYDGDWKAFEKKHKVPQVGRSLWDRWFREPEPEEKFFQRSAYGGETYPRKRRLRGVPHSLLKRLKKGSEIELFPRAREYLSRIENDGYNIGLVTSGERRRISRDLRKHKLSGVFNVVVTADDVGTEIKPCPKCLEIAARKLDLDINDCVYVGDMIIDVLAAKSCGMRFIGVDWGHNTPEEIRNVNEDRVVSTFNELYHAVKEL